MTNWSAARNAYRRAIDLNNEHFDAHYNLGTLHLQLEQYDLADRHLKQARSLDMNRPEPLLNLAVVSEKRGRFAEAESFYDAAIALATDKQLPLLTALLWRRAEFFDRRRPQRKVDMRKDLEEILRLDDTYPDANGKLGMHHESLGDYDRAIELMEKEVAEGQFDPESAIDVECLYLLARIFNDIRPNPRLALEYASQFYRLRPDSSKVRDLRRRSLRLSIDENAP